MKIPRSIWVIVALVVILAGARMVLLHYVTRHVNSVLAGVQGYTCTADDIDLYLYRGAFQLQDVYIYKTGAQREIPLLYAFAIDISVEWNALLDEALTSKVVFERVRLNFIEGDKSDQYGTGVNWGSLLKELSPLKINKVEIIDSKFTYRDLNIKSHSEFALYNCQGVIENLCHIGDSTSALPSMANLTAAYSDKGILDIKLKFNAKKAVPDLDIDLKFENIDLNMLNGFFNTYAEKTIEQGELDLYTNLALLNGKVDGFIKFEATRLKIAPTRENIAGTSDAWNSIGVYLADNQKKKPLAVRMPLAGTINDTQPATWATLWQFYSGSFLKAFEQRRQEGTIKLKTVSNEDTALKRKTEKQLKKEKRKERRKKKREERRKQKDS
jgi:hypothetical protein